MGSSRLRMKVNNVTATWSDGVRKVERRCVGCKSPTSAVGRIDNGYARAFCIKCFIAEVFSRAKERK